MARVSLESPIEYLKGVGPKKGELLNKEIGVKTFEDLLFYFPFRYVDRSSFHRTDEIRSDLALVQVKGKLTDLQKVGRPKRQRLVGRLEDEAGEIQLVWFKGVDYIAPNLKVGQDYVVFGRPNEFKGSFNIPHPEMTLLSDFKKKGNIGYEPVYNTTEKLSGRGLHSKGILKLQKTLLQELKGRIPEILPDHVLGKEGLMDREQALQHIHLPQGQKDLEEARRRLKLEELFFVQFRLLEQKVEHDQKIEGFKFERVGDAFDDFYQHHLPFELTNAQKRVLKEIRHHTGSGYHMNRLLQGDVGSGKTLVALLSMLIAKDNGFQSAMMAPTETLAIQHYETLRELLKGTDVKVGLLTGSTKQQDRKPLHEALQSGEMDIVVGTHALIEETVRFKDLGFVVIDEQHRFGVAQRARLWKKNEKPPHILVMTATPIPRTLSMTLYGDLDVSVIDELPPGRKPVKTVHRYESSRLRVFGFLKEEIAKGRQAYIVYPLIEESDKLDYKNLMEGFEAIKKAFPPPDYQVSIVHGKMKPEDKDYEMKRFAKGETDIMVATTVIEVGVDVANASVMVIESVERFGLSQLHQLRGRVGRGTEHSYCILLSGDQLSADSKKRIRTMVDTNDGFKIAEVDLELRGPGDIGGTQQSGMMDLNIANIVEDAPLLDRARKIAKDILLNDPELEDPANARLKNYLQKVKGQEIDWSRIS